MRRFRLRLPVRFLGEVLASLSRRLAGLLSRYLPTDTRPQARAKLGTTEITFFSRCARELVRRLKNFLNFLFRRLNAPSSLARGERFDAVSVADELRHDGDAATRFGIHCVSPCSPCLAIERDGKTRTERGRKRRKTILRSVQRGSNLPWQKQRPHNTAVIRPCGLQKNSISCRITTSRCVSAM